MTQQFEYEILIGRNAPSSTSSGVEWYLASDMRQVIGDRLSPLLNALGSEGWEVVAVADVGFDARSEILLKRRI
jgi:hypothetical protein